MKKIEIKKKMDEKTSGFKKVFSPDKKEKKDQQTTKK